MKTAAAPQAGRFFVFVGPAAVVGQGFAAEEGGIVGRRLVGEQDQNLALDVDTLEVVPLKFRRDDAVAHEDGLRVELHVGLLAFGDADVIVEPPEGDRFSAGLRGQGGGRLRLRADHGHSLKIGSVIAGRVGSGDGELRGDVFGGQVATAGSDAAALQQIAGEETDVRPDAAARDIRDLRQRQTSDG